MICECGNRLTDAQVKRGGRYCSAKCDGKYRPKKPAAAPKRRKLGPGYRAFIEGSPRPIPREGEA